MEYKKKEKQTQAKELPNKLASVAEMSNRMQFNF